ncbi:MAG: type II secretion system F family protein [Verrucomicrobia bacterium]|nr:type II secretion system F family protein [Verrucomicrobiota bacterium]
MAFIITPHQLSQRAEFYYQLAALTTAGISLPKALETLQRAPAARATRSRITRLIAMLEQGATFSEALRASGNWLPTFDIALLEAGEHSGRLDACFRLLEGYYRERAQLMRDVLSDLMYPLFVFHFAFLILPIAGLQRLVLQLDVAAFFAQKLIFFLPLYAVAFFGIYACQGRHGEFWRSSIEKILRPIPLLGTARRSLALARLAAALEALINAGVSIIDGWELAAASSGSPALKRAVLNWKPRVLAGQTPAEVLRETTVFPELFANLYHTGEISGQLDETLRRLHNYYQEEGTRKLKLVAKWAPWLVYLIVMGIVAYQIISFWTGYYSNLGDLLK